MLFLFALLLQLFVAFWRPHEIFEQVASLYPIQLTLAFTVFSYFASREVQSAPSFEGQQVGLATAMLFWSALTILLANSSQLVPMVMQFLPPYILFALAAKGIRTFRLFRPFVVVFFFMMLGLAALGVHQSTGPFACFERDPDIAWSELVPNGKLCEEVMDCYRQGEVGMRYACERLGLLGTSTIQGRVRYRGLLGDPNELALATTVPLPIAFALYTKKRSFGRLLLALGATAITAACCVFSQSRGGQLTFLVVMGVYGLRLLGAARGLLLSGVLAVPVLLLGGRGSDEAAESANERLGLLKTGVETFRDHMALGVGTGEFYQYSGNGLTAHNAYLLVASEQGLVGLTIFLTMIYLSVKTPLQAIRELEGKTGEAADDARAWAIALLASMAGCSVGIFFLSLSYHVFLWLLFGVITSFGMVMREVVPGFSVRATIKEVVLLLLGAFTVMVVVWYYAYRKGA